MEGDTTAYYLYKKLKHYPLNFSVIARGIAVGDELEYADEVSLGGLLKTDYHIRNKKSPESELSDFS
jgi:recombination protein RecR